MSCVASPRRPAHASTSASAGQAHAATPPSSKKRKRTAELEDGSPAAGASGQVSEGQPPARGPILLPCKPAHCPQEVAPSQFNVMLQTVVGQDASNTRPAALSFLQGHLVVEGTTTHRVAVSTKSGVALRDMGQLTTVLTTRAGGCTIQRLLFFATGREAERSRFHAAWDAAWDAALTQRGMQRSS
eukprot:Transcript_20849.p1 GENE.Transcript_20849~~Transcript_20849.p1  ORF type:complete len:208 (-),score=23.28 Transcript_20849:168-725(-)